MQIVAMKSDPFGLKIVTFMLPTKPKGSVNDTFLNRKTILKEKL